MNKTEFDHISAYLCGHKLSELLIRHYNDRFGRENRNNLHFKVSEKWRLFCFDLTTSLKNVFVNSSSDFCRATFAERLLPSDFRRATFAVFGSSADIDVVFTVFTVFDQSSGNFRQQCCTSISAALKRAMTFIEGRAVRSSDVFGEG